MQRKNNILNKTPHRSGIAMIMAITVIVIIATIMTISLSLTSQTTKRTTDLYLYEQAVLLSKSAAEYALLKIAKENNTTNPCHYTGDNFTYNEIYNIHISVSYIYTSTACSTAQQYATVTTPEQNGSVLMDISVSVNDATVVSEPIRYFKRTLQKL